MSYFSTDLYRAGWLDLVFKNRNKSYGAYLLRAESSSNTLKALLISAPLFAAVFAGPAFYQRLKGEVSAAVPVDIPVELAQRPLPVIEKAAPPATGAKPASSGPKQHALKFPSKIVVTDKPANEEHASLLSDLAHAELSSTVQAGSTGNAAQQPAEAGGGGAAAGTADAGVHELSGIDKYPEFEGGMAAWAKFIQRNLHYPAAAQEQDIQGKVFLSFVVERDGSITDVKVIKGIGGGCDQEAARVISRSPKWISGQQQGKPVRVRYTMPISFTLSN